MRVMIKMGLLAFCLFLFSSLAQSQQKKYVDVAFKEPGFKLFNFSHIKGTYAGQKASFYGMTYAIGNPVWGRLSLSNNERKTLYVGHLEMKYLTKDFYEQGYGTKYKYKDEMSFKKKLSFFFKRKKKKNIIQTDSLIIQEGYWSLGKFVSTSKKKYDSIIRKNNIQQKRIAYEILPYFQTFEKGKMFITKKKFISTGGMGRVEATIEKIKRKEHAIVFKCATDYDAPIRLDIILTATVICLIHLEHTYKTKDIIRKGFCPMYGDTAILIVQPKTFQYKKALLKSKKKSLNTHYPCDKGFTGFDDTSEKICSRIARKDEFVSFSLEVVKMNGKPIEDFWGRKNK